MPSRLLRTSFAAVSLSLPLLLSVALFPSGARAGCDNIPSETDVFRAAQGSITAPFAIPGQTMQVRVRTAVCDATSVGLGTPPACIDDSAVRVTLIFEPRDGAPANAVVLARDCGSAADPNSLQSRVAAWASQLGPGGTATCQADPTLDAVTASVGSSEECRLDFRFPTVTGPTLQLPNTLTGPARIVVEPIARPLPTALVTARCADAVATSGTIACIDELYRSDGSCSTQATSLNSRFPEFTALPIPNDFAAMASTDAGAERPALRFALDAAGNVLAPMQWSGVLCQTDANCTFEGFPPPQLVQVLFPQSLGSGLDASGQPVASGDPLSVPSGEFTSSHTLQGKDLPPIFDPSASTAALALFGSTDAVQTVIRIQTQAPGRCTDDGRACISDAGCQDGASTQTCDLAAPDLSLADLRYCRHPNACQAPDLPFTAAPVSGGPGLVPAALYAATKGGFVPLEALNLCRDSDELGCVLRNEPLAGDADANGDGDATDPSVIELRDRRAGASLPIGFDGLSGLATTLLFEPPAAVGPFGQPILEPPLASSIRPAVVTNGSCAALLFAEPWENGASPIGIDFNGDGEAFSPILRVFCRRAPGVVEEVASNAAEAAGLASLLGASARPLLLPSPRTLSPIQGGGEPLAFAGDRLYFLLDELANSPKGTEQIDVNALGQPSQGPASTPVLSSDGDVACFRSRADLLATGSPDTTRNDVYCRDVRTGSIELATRSSAGSSCSDPIERANASSSEPSLSGDGRLVCFDSTATNLLGVGGDNNNQGDVFVYDRSTCRTTRISVTATGAEASGSSRSCSLAADSGFAAFVSRARLSPQDVDDDLDVYLMPILGGANGAPLQTGTPVLVSGGVAGDAIVPSVSADGTRVAFQVGLASAAHIVVRDVAGDAVSDVVSFQFEGLDPKLSGDGRSLTLTQETPDRFQRSFLVDLVASIARDELVQRALALTSTLEDIDAKSFDAMVQSQAQGNRATFVSTANLTPLDASAFSEVHVRDLDTGLLKRIGVRSTFPFLSGDGSAVAYLQPSTAGSSVFRNGPVPGAGVDFDGGGSSRDLVLAALDLSSAPPTLDVIGAATQAAVAGSTVAFLAPDGSVFVRSCAAGTSCPATALLAPGGTSPARALAVAASESVVCAILADTRQVACARPGDAALTGLGVAGRGLGVVGDVVVLTTDEQPARLLSFRRAGADFVPAFAGGPGTRRFVLSDNGFVAFDRCEADAGTDLNGDGIEDECVLDLVDLASNQLLETGATVLPCTLEACDRRFPWRLFPAGFNGESATARFLASECQEDGNCNGCTPQSCPVDGRSCDLDQDGDCADVVVREVTFGGNGPTQIATLSGQVGSDPLAGDVSGGTGGRGAVFPTLIGRCDVDVDPATEPSTRPCQTNANCPAGLVCGPPYSVLALNDGDGDGLFDTFDNCPETFNPDQADSDGNGVGDACQVVENRCGDGVISDGEICDDGSRNGACDLLSSEQCAALGAARSYCDASCKPVVFLHVAETTINPGKNGVVPSTVFGTPYLNLGAERPFDGVTCALPAGCPANMLDLASIRLEGLQTGAACAGNGAPIDRMGAVDANGDGITDLSLKFQVQKASIEPGDDQACMTGTIRAVEGRFDATPFEARSSIRLSRRCGFGAELAPILGGIALMRRRIARMRQA